MMMNTVGFRQMQEELRSDMTLTFTNSMSFADMQAKIDQVPQYLHANLTIQFSDGTYVPVDGTTLNFKGFRGSGTLTIQGNASESGLHTNQAVIFTLGLTHQAHFFYVSCSCPVVIRNIRFNRLAAGAVYYYSIVPWLCNDITVHGCCINSQVYSSYGIFAVFSNLKAYNNTIGSHEVGIFIYRCSSGIFWDNDDISESSKPYYAYGSYHASTLSYHGIQPSVGWTLLALAYTRVWT